MKKFLISFVLLFIIFLNIDGEHFPEDVKSPMPGSRKVLLTEFSKAIPKCPSAKLENLAAIFHEHDYKTTLMIPNVLNPAPGEMLPEGSIYYTLDDFREEISSSEYGVFVAHGHAGNHGIAVEHYASSDDMVARYDEILNEGFYSIDEFDKWAHPDPKEQEYVIAITKEFIPKYAKFADNAIIFIHACYSYIWFDRNYDDEPEDYTYADYNNSDIVFLDNNVGGAFFIGLKSKGYLPCEECNVIFKYMCGKEHLLSEEGINKNFSVGESWSLFEKYFFSYNELILEYGRKKFKNDESVDKLRIYNPPKIISLKINGGHIYDYSYKDQSYPFTEGNYPGELLDCRKIAAFSGNIELEITFSKSIDTNTAFDINLFPLKEGKLLIKEQINLGKGIWSKTNFENDTWKNYFVIPSIISDFYDGEVLIAIRARDTFNDDHSSNNLDGELDTNGDGNPDGIDQNHIFTLKMPKLNFVDSKGIPKSVFATFESVFLYVVNLPYIPNSKYKIYITKDRYWKDGEPIDSTIEGKEIIISTEFSINFDGSSYSGTLLWSDIPYKECGFYDVIVDVNDNGIYDKNYDIVNSPEHPGFEIIDDRDWIDIDLEIENPPWRADTKIYPKGFSSDGKKVLLWVPFQDEKLPHQFKHSGY